MEMPRVGPWVLGTVSGGPGLPCQDASRPPDRKSHRCPHILPLLRASEAQSPALWVTWSWGAAPGWNPPVCQPALQHGREEVQAVDRPVAGRCQACEGQASGEEVHDAAQLVAHLKGTWRRRAQDALPRPDGARGSKGHADSGLPRLVRTRTATRPGPAPRRGSRLFSPSRDPSRPWGSGGLTRGCHTLAPGDPAKEGGALSLGEWLWEIRPQRGLKLAHVTLERAEALFQAHPEPSQLQRLRTRTRQKRKDGLGRGRQVQLGDVCPLEAVTVISTLKPWELPRSGLSTSGKETPEAQSSREEGAWPGLTGGRADGTATFLAETTLALNERPNSTQAAGRA